jgi:hypothetical protein
MSVADPDPDSGLDQDSIGFVNKDWGARKERKLEKILTWFTNIIGNFYNRKSDTDKYCSAQTGFTTE